MVPYQQLSGDEIRRRTQQNRENGEVEPGNFEQEDTGEQEPEYKQFGSFEEVRAYQVQLSEQYKDDLRKLLGKNEQPIPSHSEVGERVFKAEEFKSYEAVSSNESETKVEKNEFLIGNLKEISNFNQPKTEVTENKTDNVKDSATESALNNAPSSLAEITSYVDFGKWTKKGAGTVMGLFKGLFGGFKDVFMTAVKQEKPKTEAELKAAQKKKEQGAEKAAFYSRLEKTMAEARGAVQNTVAKVLVRLGLGGMGAQDMNAYMGNTRNASSEEVNVYTAFEVARKAEEAKKNQEKQVKDMQMAESQGPAINIDAAVEGGTGGGKANMSAVSAGG